MRQVPQVGGICLAVKHGGGVRPEVEYPGTVDFMVLPRLSEDFLAGLALAHTALNRSIGVWVRGSSGVRRMVVVHDVFCREDGRWDYRGSCTEETAP